MSHHKTRKALQSPEPLLPAWFRGLLIAMVTVVMSACQAPANLSQQSLEDLAASALMDEESQQTTLRFVLPETKPDKKLAEKRKTKVATGTGEKIASQPSKNHPVQKALAISAEPASPSDEAAEQAPPDHQVVQANSVEPNKVSLGSAIKQTSASVLVSDQVFDDFADIASLMEARIVPAAYPEDAGSASIEQSPSDMPASLKVAQCEPIENNSCNSCDSCPTGSCGISSCPTGCGPSLCKLPNERGPLDEYLCDGGDCGQRVGVNADWSIDGLEQEDTIAHYDTLDGEVCVAPSNKVCIYAPRFGAVRRVVNVSEGVQRELVGVNEERLSLSVAAREDLAATSLQQVPPMIGIGDNPPSLLINRMQAGELEARVVVRELKGMIKPYCNLQVIKLGIHDNAEKPWLAKAIVSALTWTGDQAAQVAIESKAASVLIGSVSPGVIYTGTEGKPCLRLIKCASCDNARPGEEIEFTLRFDNIGGEEIGNVTIVDNLTTRLEYVPDTAEASVEAKFSTKNNDAGSLILRWEIDEPLKPGEGGILQFKVRVR